MRSIRLILMLLILMVASVPFSSYALHSVQDSTQEEELVFTDIVPDSGISDTALKDTTVTTAGNRDTDSVASETVKNSDASKADTNAVQQTLWETFLAGLAGGFLAFLMPCIFPMVPLTISYFTK
ncbi:MAG: hypothetical protein V4594_05345, partial [Bacteroidota bacterium]